MEMVSLEEALSILDQQSELPLVESFTYLVQNCRKRKRLEYAKQLQAHICNSGLESHKALGNYVVPMFVECGSVPDAQKIFNRLVYRKESSWTALISAYFDCGESQKAFNLYQQMHNDSVRPSTYTAVALLRGCARLKDMERGQEIHAEIKQNGFEGDVFVDSTLIDMYAKCGFLAEAKEIFDRMPARGLVSWNALIAGYAEHGHSQEALKCFKQMQLEGISPDAVTYACSLKACGDVGAIDRGREIHIKVAEGEFENLPVENTLVGMYAKFGLLLDAREVFDEMLVHNAVSWTALMSGYAEHGAGQEALICLEEVVAEGILPDPVMLACVLKACCSIIAIDKGREIHNEIAQKGFEKELPVGNTLVDMYATCGLLAEAREVFDNLPNRTVVSWTALIGGYAEHGHGQEALSCLEHMHLDGVVPNVVTFVCVLKACGNIGAIEKGRELQLQIVQMGLEGDPSICISLIGVYADCGLLLEALEVFEKMPVRDVVAWSAMIRGYGMNHEGDKAVQCFEDMIEHGVKPDAITFTCLLNACSHTGQEFKAQEYFKIMREDYGIVPTIEHYACMVDLLARSGNTYQAERFFEALCPASEGTWGALLSACKTYGDLELGSRCFEHLCQIVPKDAAWYVLMADIYVSAGRSSDAYRVEELRKHAGAKKKPGSASIEVNKKVHTFVVGNNKSDEITSTLKMLSLHMKDEGHMPNLDLILTPTSDVGKEEALCEHAEKLAIAFGLLNTPQGETLRVTKNLRMCNDCHGASKMISRVEKREIILRDECCVHHFKDGLCSCGDLF